MDEAEWLTCNDPKVMLRFLWDKLSDRKFRLLTCALGRDFWAKLVDERSRAAIMIGERFADGDAERTQLNAAYDAAWRAVREGGPYAARFGVGATAGSCTFDGPLGYVMNLESERRSMHGPTGAMSREFGDLNTVILAIVDHLRCLSGNPFRTNTIDPSWLTSTTVNLAQGIYADRAFDCMPILADALQDAGCDNADILSHLRGPGPHVRGCWVVDCLLKKG